MYDVEIQRARFRPRGAAAPGRGLDRRRCGTRVSGQGSARLLPVLGITASRHTALRVLLKIPLPALAVPRVPGIDDFALRRGLVYAAE
jgi:hypothetical protein